MKNNIKIGIVSTLLVALAAYGDTVSYTCHDTQSAPCHKATDDRENSYDCPTCVIGTVTTDGNSIDQCVGINNSINVGCVNETPTTCTYQSTFYNDDYPPQISYPSTPVTPTASADTGNCS